MGAGVDRGTKTITEGDIAMNHEWRLVTEYMQGYPFTVARCARCGTQGDLRSTANGTYIVWSGGDTECFGANRAVPIGADFHAMREILR